jgi:hypothetical protein
MAYRELVPDTLITTEVDQTLASDRFPSDTAISNYWTGATAPIAGKITGSATGRVATQTYPSAASNGPIGASSTPTGTTETGTGGSSSTSSTSPPSPSSTNGAAEVKVAGGLLAVVIGAMAAL